MSIWSAISGLQEKAGKPGFGQTPQRLTTPAPAPGSMSPNEPQTPVPTPAPPPGPPEKTAPPPNNPAYQTLVSWLGNFQGGSAEMQDAIGRYNQQHGGPTTNAQWYGNNQTIGLPPQAGGGANGVYLVAPHTGGNNSDSWQVVQRGDESGGGAGTAPTAGPAIPGGGALTPEMMAVRQRLIDSLLQRSGQSLAIDSKTDPNIRQQVDPMAAAQERERRHYLQALAEREGPNANLRGEERLTSEQGAQAVGQHEASLVGQEIAARREEIQNALSQMGSMISDEQRQALQRELALLNDATQRLSIQMTGRGQDLNMQQFMAQLGLQTEDQRNRWDTIFGGL